MFGKIFAIILVIASLLLTSAVIIDWSSFKIATEEIPLVAQETPVKWTSPNYRGVTSWVELYDHDLFYITMIARVSEDQIIESTPILVEVFLQDNGSVLIKELKPLKQEIILNKGDTWKASVDFGMHGNADLMIFKYILMNGSHVCMEILDEG